MAAIKFEIDGKTYDFTSENFWEKFVIDSNGNIILKPKAEIRNPFERVGDYYPVLNRETRKWSITYTEIQRFGPSFKTYEVCERAIDEVIKPMLDGIAEEEIFSWKGI